MALTITKTTPAATTDTLPPMDDKVQTTANAKDVHGEAVRDAKVEKGDAAKKGDAAAKRNTSASEGSASSLGIGNVFASDAVAAIVPLETLALLQSGVLAQAISPVSDNSAAIAELSTLRSALGGPPAPDAAIAEPFAHALPKDFASFAVPSISGQTMGLAEAMPASKQAEGPRGNHKLAQQLRTIVETTFAKAGEQPPVQFKQIVGPELAKLIESKLPQIQAALQSSFQKLRSNDKKVLEGEIVIPDFHVLLEEQVAAPISSQLMSLSKELGALPKEALAKVAAAVKGPHDATPLGKLAQKLSSLLVPAEPVSEQTRHHASEGAAFAGSAPVFPVSVRTGLEGIDLDNADIGFLMYMVMTESVRMADDNIRDIIKQTDARNKEKKLGREQVTKMKEQKARIENEGGKEYDTLLAQGAITNPDFKKEDYIKWRQADWDELGNASLSHPVPPLPPTALKAESRAGATGTAPQIDGVAAYDAMACKALADQYGVAESDIQRLYASYQLIKKSPDASKSLGSFTEWLAADAPGAMEGVNLKAANGDPKIAAENEAKINKFKHALKAWDGFHKISENAKIELVKEDLVDPLQLTTPRPMADEIPGSPKGDTSDPLTIPRYPTSKEVQAMSTAEIKALWDSITATIPAPHTPASFDEFMAIMTQFFQGHCNGVAAAGAANTVLKDALEELIGKDPVLAGLTMEVNKRMCKAFNDSVGRALYSEGEVVYPGMLAKVDPATLCTTIGAWRIPLGADMSDFGNDWLNATGQGLPGVGGKPDYGVTYSKAMKDLNQAAADKKKPKQVESKPEAKGPSERPVETLLSGWDDAVDMENAAKQAATDIADKTKNAAKGISSEESPAFSGTVEHGSIEMFGAAIDAQQSKLDSAADLEEMDSLRLQRLMDQRSKMMETLSNIMKKMSDTSSTLTKNQS